jgi:hypothetical protein
VKRSLDISSMRINKAQSGFLCLGDQGKRHLHRLGTGPLGLELAALAIVGVWECKPHITGVRR